MTENLESEDYPLDVLTREQRKKLKELKPVYDRVRADLPSLMQIVDDIFMEESARHPPDHPISRLCQYLESLQNACLQASYSIERVNYFCTEEEDAATIVNFGFYVEHYVYDLLTRVKTATDILALIIRHIFELKNLKDEDCALDRGKISGTLRKNRDSDQLREELAKKLDRALNRWTKPFYDLRNEVIHRTGLRIISSSPNNFSLHRFNIRLPLTGPIVFGRNPLNRIDDLKPLADQGEPLSKFLVKIGSRSLSPVDHGIDVVKFCIEVWELLAVLVEEVIKSCELQMDKFISAKKP